MKHDRSFVNINVFCAMVATALYTPLDNIKHIAYDENAHSLVMLDGMLSVIQPNALKQWIDEYLDFVYDGKKMSATAITKGLENYLAGVVSTARPNRRNFWKDADALASPPCTDDHVSVSFDREAMVFVGG